MTAPRIAVGLLLLFLPVGAVLGIKQTHWGPLLTAPPERIQGPAHAPVMIFEYSDFQCPSCALSQAPLHRLMNLYKDKVQLAYKYFPLTRIHHNALAAAHAAECAAAQKKFWPYHDQLFQTQTSWAPLTDPTTSFMAIAQSSGLNIPAFQGCYADPSRLAIIEADMDEGQRREVSATPTFFIGDTRLVGGGALDADGARTVDRELRQ